jgi:FkbM family methyltransferase
MSSWARHFEEEPSPALIKSVADDYLGALVVSFELSPLLQRILDACGIPWVDIGISPLRFLQDYAMSFRMSRHFDGAFPPELALDAAVIETSVKRVRSTYLNRAPTDLNGALVFFAQTSADRTLIKNGSFIGAQEAVSGLRNVMDGRRVFIKPHPLDPGNPVVAAVILELGAELIEANTYEILASDADVSVATLASSVGMEAVAFGKKTHVFHPKVQSWAFSGPTVLQHAFSPELWSVLLSRLTSVDDVKVPPWQPNKLRKERGYYGLDPAVWEPKTATTDDNQPSVRVTEPVIVSPPVLRGRLLKLSKSIAKRLRGDLLRRHSFRLQTAKTTETEPRKIVSKILEFSFAGVHFPVRIDEAETIISKTIESTGVWEANQLCLYNRLVSDGEVFVDIGANVGINSLFMSRVVPSARVVAIEASPLNHELLKKNISGSPIESHCLAIADLDGEITFSGSGTNAKIGAGVDGTSGYKVPARKLDTLVEELRIDHIALLKIDVEGYTDVVLSGADEALKKTRRVIVEFSIGDIVDRFKCDVVGVVAKFSELFDVLSAQFPHLYYISRGDGLIEINNAVDLNDLLLIEEKVGDILGSREPMPGSITQSNFLLRKINQLLPENHYRIMENQNLQHRVAELENTIARIGAALSSK